VDECKKKEHRLEAEVKNRIALVIEANALRTKSKLKREDLEEAI